MNYEQSQLKKLLKDLPDQHPPPNLTESVLRLLEPKKSSIWRRIYLWSKAHHTITFRPLKLIPAVGLMAAVILLMTYFFPVSNDPVVSIDSKSKMISITFTLQHPAASSVNLIGSFNHWNPSSYAMQSQSGENIWSLNLELSPGRHEYAFLIDGKVVVSDPNSPFVQNDGFGNKNSILYIEEENGHQI